MTADIKTHDVAVATKARDATERPRSAAPSRRDSKPNARTETAPRQVQPEGR